MKPLLINDVPDEVVEILKKNPQAKPLVLEALASIADQFKKSTSKPSPEKPSHLRSIYVDGGAGGWVQKLGLGNVSLGQVTDSEGNSLLNLYQQDLDLPMPIQEVVISGIPTHAIVCDFRDPNAVQQKNNEAELVALMAGLQIALQCDAEVVYSDSQLILEYWSQNHVNAKKRKVLAQEAPTKLATIEKCSQLRRAFEGKGGILRKVSGAQNPADFGFH